MTANRFQKMSKPASFAFAFALLYLTITSVTAQGGQNATALSAGSSQSAGRPSSGTEAVITVVHVKYADVQQVRYLLDFFNLPMRSVPGLKVITLEGPPARVAAVEEAIKQLDVPPPPAQDIVITGYLLMASRQAAPEGTVGKVGSWALPEVAGSVIPPQLNGVIDQLKRVLNYKHFALVDALTLSTVDRGGASVSGLTPIGRTYSYPPQNSGRPTRSDNVEAHVEFRVGLATIIRRERTSSVSLHELQLRVMPMIVEAPPASMYTDIDVGQNQQVVVGKTDVLSPDLALFLVISAKITD
jgi:hypothetical protein